jgi:hypothetical protein
MKETVSPGMPESIDPSEYSPDTQEGVSYSKPKDLDAASNSHPLYQRALEFNLDESDGVNAENGTSIPWTVPPAALKHMADGLYQSEEATIREFIANCETACLRVEDGEAAITPTNYNPVIEITFDKSKNLLVVQDNGIGIASATGVQVLRKIGVTTARDTGTQSGQFGMGLASFLKLIGSQNSMIMKTRSRMTDENYAAYVNLGGFDPIKGGMPQGTYGTRFEMIPKSSINSEDIRSYVETYSKHLRVPVHYEEIDEKGKQVFDEDWQRSSLVSSYGDDKISVTYSKSGLVTAATSPEASGETLLVSMPIERNDPRSMGNSPSHECPYAFDVRIEDESGAVVECTCERNDHEGLTPVPNNEYQMMDSNQKEEHMPVSELSDNDITLPQPVTSRDTLQEDEDFWFWISSKLAEKMEEECTRVYQEFGSVEEVLNQTA